MELTAIIEKKSTGFSGYFKEIDSLTTVGDTIEEIKANFRELLNEYISYLEEEGKETLEWKKSIINYVIDIEQLFDYYKVINKTAFAKYIGINPILFRQYTKKLVPISDQRMRKITEGIHRLADELNTVVLY
ncbi:MAG: type II toxin-antitoxin system HicB family antitoxin [Flavobacteriales bacterium AspAUS03]